MPMKDRLLVLLQTLQEKSDDETWLTTAELRSVLEKEGHFLGGDKKAVLGLATEFLKENLNA